MLDLADQLASRTKELSQLRGKTEGRALIVLAYAHLEGFLREGTLKYLQYALDNRPQNKNLAPGIIALLHWNTVQQHFGSLTLPSGELIKIVQRTLDPLHRFKLPKKLDLEGNVSSTVMQRLLGCLEFDIHQYPDLPSLLDNLLLKPRNEIAHGGLLEMSIEAARERADKVVVLLRQFKTDIENAATTKKFLTAAP